MKKRCVLRRFFCLFLCIAMLLGVCKIPVQATEDGVVLQDERKEEPDSLDEQSPEEEPDSLEVQSPEEEPPDENPYFYYYFGDPAYNGNYIAGYRDNGEEILELYSENLDEIIRMAEEGMDLTWFFRDTIFSGFSLDDLYRMREYGYSFDQIVELYLSGEEIPDWLGEALFTGKEYGISLTAEEAAGVNTMTASGVTKMSISELGVIPSLGSSKKHGNVVQLRATGDNGTTYPAFCASYGGSYRRGYTYQKADYSACVSPNGKNLSSYQFHLMTCVVNTYYKATAQQDRDYAAAQLIIWYIINNMPDDSVYFDPDAAWESGGLKEAAVLIGGSAYAEFIHNTILSYSFYINMWWDGTLDLDHFEPVDYYPGQHADLQFWCSATSNSQWIITYSIGEGAPEVDGLVIPYIDNHYMEKKATANYHVEITKESIITNELLADMSFEIVESEADGYDLNYEIIRGTYAQDGQDYPDASTEAGNFGQKIEVTDMAPYMDADVKPSGWQHKTVISTDENGYACTVFTHTHTFKEFFSLCLQAPGQEITYEVYQALWEEALRKAEEAQASGETLQISYKGASKEMEYEEVKEIYDKQQVVYTQTKEAAVRTLNDLYDAYLARSYRYTVTELDRYVRSADRDSNGKLLKELSLPKDGYRKDVRDATTIDTYSAIVANEGTMIVGGTNDSDPNTKEKNVTNEPWHNQIFIHKTDLESGNQILYDTIFDIYEYYQYKVDLIPKKQKLYPSMLLASYKNQQGSALVPENIVSARLVVLGSAVTPLLEKELEVEKMVEGLRDTSDYVVEFDAAAAGSYRVQLILTLNDSNDLNAAISRTIYDGSLVSTGEEETYELYHTVKKRIPVQSNADGSLSDMDGGMIRFSWDQDTNITTYHYIKSDGTEHILTSNQDGAVVNMRLSGNELLTEFSYEEMEKTGVMLTTEDDGMSFRGRDEEHEYVAVQVDGDTYILYYQPGSSLANGEYIYEESFQVAPSDLTRKSVDKNVGTDMGNYQTWGQQNYEVVRITGDIAKKMGWPDTVIGMYTVHRLSPTDAYTGTTFTSAVDEATREPWGYYEYGTLYYTQANLGNFAIVESKAPANGEISGYLGNYEDRTYDYLKKDGAPSMDKQSSVTEQKKYDGTAPYGTLDSVSEKKSVHLIDLCTDTNQYASYMLNDGYKKYEDIYYANYVETLDDVGQTPTYDGYDGDHYEQSGLKETIALERYEVEDPVRDILNRFWDEYFSQSLRVKSGLLVNRASQKQDTYFRVLQKTPKLSHFVGTTIHLDSFADNDSKESNLTFQGTYTETARNYHSYTPDAAELNRREGFHHTRYLQVGNVDYDNGAEEKKARFFHTEKAINKSQAYAFINERPYGYLRFSKYDAEAERYVDNDLKADYISGTDHADADLDGAVYSLYVAESNPFIVTYYAGMHENKICWAQPLKTGGFRLIEDADDSDAGFTDRGNNAFSDYPHAYLSSASGESSTQRLYLDYNDRSEEYMEVSCQEKTYYGIRHPDGLYGGANHNGFYAVLKEQQVFVDTNEDGFSDTWTLQDITLCAGAKVASAPIFDGELKMDGLYLGNYDLMEEIRDAIVISSVDSLDREVREIRWLSFAPGYLADTDSSGNPTRYPYVFPYVNQVQEETMLDAEQIYIQKETSQYCPQEVIKGAGFQFHKQKTNGESASSGNTTGEALAGAGFKVYLISELSLIQNHTIQPVFTIEKGNQLVRDNQLTALFDAAGNMSGYQFTRTYLDIHHPFEQKYGSDYRLEEVNRIVYVAGNGYYYMQDILDAYRNQYYSNETRKWDFTGEDQALARMYENHIAAVEEINRDYEPLDNRLNQGAACEWYGVNGISNGWEPTSVRNEYRLSELFTNENGNLRSPELPWGAYLVVETTTPMDVFTVDPIFVTITDSSPSANRARKVALTDASFLASLILVKRDGQSGQDILQKNIAYRIWDDTNQRYVQKYLLGENGELTMVARDIFTTDEDGRLNAVASLEAGTYRIEELDGPEGYYNIYRDLGDPEEGNSCFPYIGTVEFEVTTDRLYQSTGIVSSGNLDYIYIGETFFNNETLGKLNILKTGEVLVDYADTDGIEYADEFRSKDESGFQPLKSSMRERRIWEQLKDAYDLGTDTVEKRSLTGIPSAVLLPEEPDQEAVYSREEDQEGTSYDFVYEERPLAGAVFQIRAAEDIPTQDGNEGYWFRKGDVAATVSTGAEGEMVSYVPVYQTADSPGGGAYDFTYYYGGKDGRYPSLTGEKCYEGKEFSSTGSIVNHWIWDRMSELERKIYKEPAFDEKEIYPNTFYQEQNIRIYRRLYRSSKTEELQASDYVTRLEKEGDLTTETGGIVTKIAGGYRLSFASKKQYEGARLLPDKDGFQLKLADGTMIEVKESRSLYRILEDKSGLWATGDLVEKTAGGYLVTHTDVSIPGKLQGSETEGAGDLGITKTQIYPNAVIREERDGSFLLLDAFGNEIARLEGGLYLSSDGGIVEKTGLGYEISYERHQDFLENPYASGTLRMRGAVLTVGNEKMQLLWDELHQNFVTMLGNTVDLAEDRSYVTVTINGVSQVYEAFDLLMEYDLYGAVKQELVKIQKDGTLGSVSVCLPLGKYEIQEIETPYGFLINERVQTVEFQYGDQVKEVVFNSNSDSIQHTEETMEIWKAKGLFWFLGGWNTIGEKEEPAYEDAEGTVSFYDQRVRSWSQKETPVVPESPEEQDPDSKEERREESVENQWKLGVGIYKADQDSGASLAGARFGLYTRDAIYNVDGKQLAAPDQLLAVATTDVSGFANFGVDLALMSKNQDASSCDKDLICEKTYLRDENKYLVKTSIDGNTAYNTGAYYIKELTPPDGYLLDDTRYEVQFSYQDEYTMYVPVYAEHENIPTKVMLTKMDLTGSREVQGATVSVYRIKDIYKLEKNGQISHADGNLELLDRWISSERPHEMQNLLLSNREWPRLSNREPRDNVYVFREELPADGYVTAADIEFKIYQKPSPDSTWHPTGGTSEECEVFVKQMTESPEWKKWKDLNICMYDDVTKVEIAKQDLFTKEQLTGAVLRLYSLGKEFSLPSLTEEEEFDFGQARMVMDILTREEVHRLEKLPIGWYVIRELKAPEGYLLSSDPVFFQIKDTPEVQGVTIYNQTGLIPPIPEPPVSPPEEEGSPEEEIHVDIPVPEPEPVWSNPRTEDSGEDGFSILLKKEKGIGWILLLLGCVGAGVALIKRRERK